MSDKEKIIPYLSDEELNKLITDIEDEMPVQAPAGIENKVLSFIDLKRRRKNAEFGKYCARVGFAVAAAIALVCIVPFIPDAGVKITPKDSFAASESVISREEILGRKTVRSREEVLNKTSAKGYLEETESFLQSQIENLFK